MKPGFSKTLNAMVANRERQNELFPKDSRRPECRIDGLRRTHKVGPVGNQVGAGLAIGKHDVLVVRIDFGKRSQQIAEIDLGAAHAARNQVQGVDADANHLSLRFILWL